MTKVTTTSTITTTLSTPASALLLLFLSSSSPSLVNSLSFLGSPQNLNQQVQYQQVQYQQFQRQQQQKQQFRSPLLADTGNNSMNDIIANKNRARSYHPSLSSPSSFSLPTTTVASFSSSTTTTTTTAMAMTRTSTAEEEDVMSSSSAVATSVRGDSTKGDGRGRTPRTIGYKSLSVIMKNGVSVPVACWFPVEDDDDDDATGGSTGTTSVTYDHRISVRKIGRLLAGWDFIPEFVSSDFRLTPSVASEKGTTGATARIVNGNDADLPKEGPAVILAHGYLGSRYDLSHLAEKLTSSLGIVCLAPEYPESLSASYGVGGEDDGAIPISRADINDELLQMLSSSTRVTKYGIIGHSLGTGTVLKTGDSEWTRVCIAGALPGMMNMNAGNPGADDYKGLYISSYNDGAVSLRRRYGDDLTVVRKMLPTNYAVLNQDDDVIVRIRRDGVNDNGGGDDQRQLLPDRSVLLYENDDGPNHISFLSEGVNDSMIRFLSPLLPVAKAMNIPVLDFDKYQASRDSYRTSESLHPVILRYVREQMQI